MNWVGGARNRIRISDEKRKQQEFFRKRKLANTCQKLKAQAQKTVPTLSQDLLLFQALDSCFQRPQTITPKKVTQVDLDILSKRRKIHRFDVELPLSPVVTPLKAENRNETKVFDEVKMQQFSHSVKKQPFTEHCIEHDFKGSAQQESMSIYSEHVQTIQECENHIALNILPVNIVDNVHDSIKVNRENRRNIAAALSVEKSVYGPLRSKKKSVIQKTMPLISTVDFLKSNNLNSLYHPHVKSKQNNVKFPSYSEINHKILTKTKDGSLDLAIFKESSLKMNKDIPNEAISHSSGDCTLEESFTLPLSTTFDSVSELCLSGSSEKSTLLTQSHFSYSKSVQRASTSTNSKPWDIVKNGYSLYPVNNFSVELKNHVPDLEYKTDMHKKCLNRVSKHCERVTNPRKQENVCQGMLGLKDTDEFSGKKDATTIDIQTSLNVKSKLESLTAMPDKHDKFLNHITKKLGDDNKENNSPFTKPCYNGVNKRVSAFLDENGCLHSEKNQIDKDLCRSPITSCQVVDHESLNSQSSRFDVISVPNEDSIKAFQKRIVKKKYGHNILPVTNQDVTNKDEKKETFESVGKQRSSLCEFSLERYSDKNSKNMNIMLEWPWKETFSLIMNEIFNRFPLLPSINDQRELKNSTENTNVVNTFKILQTNQGTSFLSSPSSLTSESKNSNCKNLDNINKNSDVSSYILNTQLKEKTKKNSTHAKVDVITTDHGLSSVEKCSTIFDSLQNNTDEHKQKKIDFNLRRVPENNISSGTEEFVNDIADDVTKYFPSIHFAKLELEEEPIISQTEATIYNREQSQKSPTFITSSKIEKFGELCKENDIHSGKVEVILDSNENKQCTTFLENENKLQDASLFEIKGAINTDIDDHNLVVTYPFLTTRCSQGSLKFTISENKVQKENCNIHENNCKNDEKLKSVLNVSSPVDSSVLVPQFILDSSFKSVANSRADSISVYKSLPFSSNVKISPCKMALELYSSSVNTVKLTTNCDSIQSKIASCPSSDVQLTDTSIIRCNYPNKYKSIGDIDNKQCMQKFNQEKQYCVYNANKLSKATQCELVANHKNQLCPQKVLTAEESTQTQNTIADFGGQSVVTFSDISTQTPATKVKEYKICDIS